ncbi:MAG TPA: c-type cytochrome [Anaerolineales bacterium]|nr:c-type cytochrome [Anaerolineales bacterium]
MLRKSIVVSILVAVVSVLSLVPAWGGGWAVVTLDAMPTGLKAGEPFDVGFTVLQHGRTPLSGLAPVVMASSRTTDDEISITAQDEGAVGHYAANLTLPAAGDWTWAIDAFGALHPMPSLTVAGSSAPPAAAQAPSAAVVAGAGLAALLGLGLALRRRLAYAAGAMAVAVVLAGAGFFQARPATAAAAEAMAPPSSAEEGADLFIAKGCISCHLNAEFAAGELLGGSIGPDLTLYSGDAEFLRKWLANPEAVRPGTGMPDLDLDAEEIEALIAFLNQD